LLTYQQKLRMTTASLAAGDYRIGYSAEIASSHQNVPTEVKVEIDDTTIIAEAMSPRTSVADQYVMVSGFAVQTLTAGVHTIDVDYRSTGVTAKIRRVRLEIYPVP
jgi:hypothetical protein